MKSILLPFALLWLAVHVALLALFLGAKFAATRLGALVILACALCWFLAGRRKPALPRLSRVV